MEFVGLEDFARNHQSLKDKFKKHFTTGEKEEGNYYTDRIEIFALQVVSNHEYNKSET